MGGPEPAGSGDLTFDLAHRPDGADFLLKARAFGEYAQFQHGACAGGEIDDHIGVVPNVGGFPS